MMLKLTTFILIVNGVYGWFTLPGKCPKNVKMQDNFRLAEFYGKWHQVYHYSSEGQSLNCTTIELITKPTGVYLNQSRVDSDQFHRYSIGKVVIPPRVDDAAKMDLIYTYTNHPMRLRRNVYHFYVLATNSSCYATVYTCQYSTSMDKHFIYVWILSRIPSLDPVSKELAIRPLQQIGVDANTLVNDDLSRCTPQYYEDTPQSPMTFRTPF